MKLIKFIALVCFSILVTGCASTKADLMTSKHNRELMLTDNYQAVYQRVYSNAKNCLEGNANLLGTIRNVVDGQLYQELGYGELSFYQTNLSNIHFHYVKIERVGSGSRVKVFTGGKLAVHNESDLNLYSNWAQGKEGCP